MGLILPQTVKVKLYGKMPKHLEKLGYMLPMKKSEYDNKLVIDTKQAVEVDVLDLLPKSSYRVNCFCDECSKPSYITYNEYNIATNFGNNSYYCQKCAMKIKNSGENNPAWNPNKTEEERIVGRDYDEYNYFVKDVLARDNYTCQRCGQKNGDLTVHHLDGYNWCIDKRTEVTNGITLCNNCHKFFHSIFGHGNNTKEQFEEWMGHPIELNPFTGERSSLPSVYCFETDTIYKNYYEAAKMNNCSWISIQSVCGGRVNTVFNKHYIYYYKLKDMSNTDICNYLLKGKNGYKATLKIICLTTGLLFNNIKEAANYYSINDYQGIYRAINYNVGCGKYNCQSLHWIYLLKYESLSLEEKQEIYNKNQATILKDSFLYNLFN